ncbi:MAG: tRNA pseudouridine(38-40) synthase TruA [Coriobacteriia bacterium]|nr:tRNA pseudouridine(38-40) synthase TruA [Coriobacteriia bacterium]
MKRVYDEEAQVLNQEAMSQGSFALTIAYHGALFHGFARQPGVVTVQDRLEEALLTVLGHEVETVCAGRTDAGVHALGQVVGFSVPEAFAASAAARVSAVTAVPEPPEAFGSPEDASHPGALGGTSALRRSLDALAGEGIVVRSVRATVPGFSARFDALAREYRYLIVPGPAAPLFLDAFAWHVPAALDAEAMGAAARALIGEHDFRSFCTAASAEGKNTVRRVETIEITAEQHLGEGCLSIRVVGNAFLHSMVRVIVGTLVEVGSGHRPCAWVAEALDACAREAAGPTAPAKGLTLIGVCYPDEVWL